MPEYCESKMKRSQSLYEPAPPEDMDLFCARMQEA